MCGAIGMLSAFTSSMEGIGTDILLNTKMVGLTTDGENANMGKKGGLWALVAEYLGRTPTTIWCVAHRSDFAFESFESHPNYITGWLTFGVWQPISGPPTFEKSTFGFMRTILL